MLWERVKAGFSRLLNLIKDHYVLAFLVTLSLVAGAYFVIPSFLAMVLTSVACIFVGPVLGGLLGGMIDKIWSLMTRPSPAPLLPESATSNNKPYTGPEKLSTLAEPVMGYNTTKFLDAKDHDNLSFAFKEAKGVLKLRRDARDIRILEKFLTCVARGEQDKAEGLLKCGNASKWLLMKGKFTDYSGRTFNCTAYQYAYWAKDTHMCRMFEKYMDATTKNSVLKLIYNEEKNEDRELTWEQQGQPYHSTHCSLDPLKEALQNYVKDYDRWLKTKNSKDMETAWMNVAKAQRDVPAHVAQEYCREDRSFDPCPKFNESTLPRVLKFYNRTTNVNSSWFPLVADSDPGFNFGLYKATCWGRPCATRMWTPQGAVGIDLAAIARLDEVRTADLTQSRENLNQPAILHEVKM